MLTSKKERPKRSVVEPWKWASCSRVLAARIASYELAYRMQSSAEDAVDVNQETDETKASAWSRRR